MALRWLEGFETHRNPTLMLRKYAAGSTFGGVVGSSVGWQSKGFCADCSNNGANVDLTTRPIVGSVGNSWIMGWAWQLSSPGALTGAQVNFPTVALHNSVGQQLQFEMVIYTGESKPGGYYWQLRVRRGSTVLATSTKIFEGSLWYFIEVKATVRTGTNGSFEMRWWTPFSTTPTVDTFQGATLTGINTANQGTDGADRARMFLGLSPTSSGWEVDADDWYVCDNTGSANNDYLGKQMIEGLQPNGNGNSIVWDLAGGATNVTDAWAESALTTSTTEDDKRVTSDVTDEKELATYTDLTYLLKNTIRGLLLHTDHKMDTSGSRNFVPLLRKTTGSPVEFEGTQVLVTGTAVTGSSEVFEVDPNTSAAWTQTNLNAAEFGVKTKA